MKRNIYYSSAYESQEEQFGQGNCRGTNVFCKWVFFALKFAGKLAQLSVSVLLSSLIYEHLLSHGILKERNSYFQRVDSILLLLLAVVASSYRVRVE
jgi:hypothetical protein